MTNPSAVLFAGFDIAKHAEVDVLAWHSTEHFPERIALPGFRRGRRFVRNGGQPKYLVLYELDDLGVLSSTPYLERLNNPTPWTTRSVRQFRNNFRTAYQVAHVAGEQSGPFLMACRLATSGVATLLPHLSSVAHLPVRLMLASPSIIHSSIETAESHVSGNAILEDAILILESPTDKEIHALLSTQPLSDLLVASKSSSIYQLQAEVI